MSETTLEHRGAALADGAPAHRGTPHWPTSQAGIGTLPPSGSLNDAVLDLASRLRAATAADNAQAVTFEALEALVGALCGFYAADVEERGSITALKTTGSASPTAVLMTTTALLRGANLELFELGMWQSWSGMK